MSEFSESLHLRSARMEDGVSLLQRARVAGYVFRAGAGWVPMVVPVFYGSGAVERVVAANTGVLVHYAYAEDHGVEAVAYRGSEPIARVRVSFEGNRIVFERERFIAAGLMTTESAARVQRWIDDGADRGVLAVASALGLTRHEGFSFEGAERDRDAPPSDRVEVSAKGTIVTGDDEVPAVRSAAPSPRVVEGPFERLARAVKRLIDDGSLVLTSNADVDDLVEALVAALAESPGNSPENTVLEALVDHELVDEVFADESAVARALSAP